MHVWLNSRVAYGSSIQVVVWKHGNKTWQQSMTFCSLNMLLIRLDYIKVNFLNVCQKCSSHSSRTSVDELTWTVCVVLFVALVECKAGFDAVQRRHHRYRPCICASVDILQPFLTSGIARLVDKCKCSQCMTQAYAPS